MLGLCCAFAVILILAHRKLKVKEDPRVEELAEKLPGLNCGACGHPSCREFAAHLVRAHEAAPAAYCRSAGPEARKLIEKITGASVSSVKKNIAVVLCGADNSVKTKKGEYKGIPACRSAELMQGGGMACAYGCLGYGDCAAACPFGAIRMNNGLPSIDPDKCVACGKCVEACPRGIIHLMPYDRANLVIAACSSRDPGARVRAICKVGCIGCRICEKLSKGAFAVKDNLSRIDTERLNDDVPWDTIVNKCPTHTIVKIK